MANFNLYFTCCTLLFTWAWRSSSGVPVRALDADRHAQCALLFRTLLHNVTELLSNEDLCYAIPSDKVMVRSDGDTVVTCAPTQSQNSGCVRKINSSFSESECLKNIMKDLALYGAAFQSYLQSELRRPEVTVELLRPTLEILTSLRKNCSVREAEEKNEPSEMEAATRWDGDVYENRYKMCKMMRGFHIRTITINRAMGYISSGDHRQ